MAMDTAAKRGSAMFIRSPWRKRLPLPDSTIDQGDRQATAFMYSGILAEAGSQAGATSGWAYCAFSGNKGHAAVKGNKGHVALDEQK